MPNFAYVEAKELSLNGALDLKETGLDVRMILVMTNTTADTQQTARFVGDITTLDEYDGTGYARQNMANQVVVRDDPNLRAEFNHDVVTFASLDAGTRQAQAHLYYSHVTNDADSPLLFYVDTGGYPFDGNGGDVTVTPNVEGAAQQT